MLALELLWFGKKRDFAIRCFAMLMEKLSLGVLRVVTPAGPRYIKPELPQRLYLVWMFRHFQMLPSQVLSQRQRRLIDDLCRQHQFVSAREANGQDDLPVLGTVDWRPQPEGQDMPLSWPGGVVRAAVARFAASVQHRS
jgi:hypothetical protein